MSDTDKQKHLPWNEGLSTRQDVDMLVALWPDLKPGDRKTYGEFADALRLNVGSNRFWTVADAWRKRLFDTKGLTIDCEKNTAFYVATPEQVLAKPDAAAEKGRRMFRKEQKRMQVTKFETQEQRETAMHRARVMAVLAKETKKARMNLIPMSVTQPPQIRPPKAVGDDTEGTH